MAKSEEMLEEMLVNNLDQIKDRDINAEGNNDAVDNVVKLMKVKNEIETRKDEAKARADEAQARAKESVWHKIMDGVRVGVDVASVIVPAVIYTVWLKRGFEFEKEGTYTSGTFRSLTGKLRPNK